MCDLLWGGWECINNLGDISVGYGRRFALYGGSAELTACLLGVQHKLGQCQRDKRGDHLRELMAFDFTLCDIILAHHTVA